MYRWNNKEYKCPIETTIDVLGGKWRSLIVWHLNKEILRFSEMVLCQGRIPNLV